MWSKIAAAGLAALVVTLGALPADAQNRNQRTRVIEVDSPDLPGVRYARVVKRVPISRRSYLDAGTEVKRGERKYLDYAFPPNYSAFDVVDGSRVMYGRSTIPDHFQLPGWSPNIWD
jgi:hypothetical protein